MNLSKINEAKKLLDNIEELQTIVNVLQNEDNHKSIHLEYRPQPNYGWKPILNKLSTDIVPTVKDLIILDLKMQITFMKKKIGAL